MSKYLEILELQIQQRKDNILALEEALKDEYDSLKRFEKLKDKVKVYGGQPLDEQPSNKSNTYIRVEDVASYIDKWFLRNPSHSIPLLSELSSIAIDKLYSYKSRKTKIMSEESADKILTAIGVSFILEELPKVKRNGVLIPNPPHSKYIED